MDKEQQQRERAYKIWEEEGRPNSRHEEHWQRAENQHEGSEQDAADITETNQNAADAFNDSKDSDLATDIHPPSTISPD